MDGAFDLTHFGHANAFRQARELGCWLIVGVNSDASIAACKGTPPLMSESERIAVVRGCRCAYRGRVGGWGEGERDLREGEGESEDGRGERGNGVV